MMLPSTLERFLADMEYPASKDDLRREAAHDGLGVADRDLLAQLPDRSYSSRWHVRLTLSRTGTPFERVAALA